MKAIFFAVTIKTSSHDKNSSLIIIESFFFEKFDDGYKLIIFVPVKKRIKKKEIKHALIMLKIMIITNSVV